jgi:hypothetical protein
MTQQVRMNSALQAGDVGIFPNNLLNAPGCSTEYSASSFPTITKPIARRTKDTPERVDGRAFRLLDGSIQWSSSASCEELRKVNHGICR